MALSRLIRSPIRSFSRYFATYEKVGSKNLDWANLGFSYVPTQAWLQHTHKDGEWSKTPKLNKDPYINLHICSNALHYGQALFEGLKAFHCKDGKVRAFGSDYNSERLNKGAARMGMPLVPLQTFRDTIDETIRLNAGYVPPYGTNGAMYMRPVLFGCGAQLGLGPAPEYVFGVIAVPVGSYYKTGLKAVDALVLDNFDRAAPQGVGNIKCAGNYGADVKPAKDSAAKGYTISLYLDAKEHKYVEEFSTSNFIAIDKKGAFVTPISNSILDSVTNRVLQKLAQDMGIKVERRPIPWDEVPTLREIAACGTAVVITPIKSITRGTQVIKCGEINVLQKLYNRVRAVQVGDEADKHGFHRVVM